MSGVKYATLAESLEAEREALRRLAAEREARARAKAESKLTALVTEQLELARVLSSGAAEPVGRWLKAAPKVAVQPSMSSEDIERLAAGAERITAIVRRAGGLLRSAERVSADLAVTIAKSLVSESSAEGMTTVVERWSTSSQLAEYAALLVTVRDAVRFLDDCVAARIGLSADAVAVRSLADTVISSADPRQFARFERDFDGLERESLAAMLRLRRGELEATCARLRTTEWTQRLDAWRPGLGDEVARAASGDWQKFSSVLEELDAFLGARAERRIELLSTGGSLVAGKVRREGADGELHVTLNDDAGDFIEVTDRASNWRSLGREEERVLLQGPTNYDGPACARGGLGEHARRLAAQGVSIRVTDQEGMLVHESVAVADTTNPVLARRVELDVD